LYHQAKYEKQVDAQESSVSETKTPKGSLSGSSASNERERSITPESSPESSDSEESPLLQSSLSSDSQQAEAAAYEALTKALTSNGIHLFGSNEESRRDIPSQNQAEAAAFQQ